uniref:Cytochrome P450 n=1 Tax=Globodera pallida TaxID=36090 RepID=A0A183BPJ4_GLOPA
MLLCLVAVSLFIFAVCRLYGILSTHMRLKRTSDAIYNIADTIPFIGQAHVFPKNSFKAIRKGHHLMRWWCANKFFIFMMDGETAKIILESTVELKKGPDYKFFHQWLGNGVLRRMLLPIFRFSMLKQYTHTFNKYGQMLAQNLAELQGKRELVDVSPLLIKCALYNVTESVMGVQMNLEQKLCRKYMEAIKNFGIYQHIYALCPLYILFPVTWYLFGHGFATRRCVKALKAFSTKVVEDRIRINTANGGIKKDVPMHAEGSLYKIMAFLDFLLALKGEDKLSIEQVREQVDGFMFGGHDTIANVLMWFLWSMACHPEYQQRLHAEIVDHFGVEEALELTASDVNELPYLDRCIRETMRMFPVIPVLERELLHDLRIGDQTLPRGVTVAILPLIIHHNEKVYPRHWEFDPDNFLPERVSKRSPYDYLPFSAGPRNCLESGRWEFDPDNFLPERVSKRSPYDYLPFSAGPRNCLGNRFAMLELKIILVHVFRRLRFSTTIPFEKNRPALEAVSRLELGCLIRVHAH